MINISNYMYEELLNWRRWCLSSGGGGHCMSLEHRYQSESDLDRVATAYVEIRNFDALAIEKQLSSLTFPKKQRRLIINEYIWRRPYIRTCKELGITFSEYDQKVINAVNILENRLNKTIDKYKEQEYIKLKLTELAMFTL
jgi:hypothetical protein